VEHRLRTIVQGAPSAAIRSDVELVVNDGVFLPEGSRVSLQAQPQPSAVFAGWSGDTTSRQDTLTVLMRHPFDLIANYVTFRGVALNSAADGILGIATLPGEDLQYLDAAGNRNGSYDLGDFLSAVDRGQTKLEMRTMARMTR
jgi:hypothetical protein